MTTRVRPRVAPTVRCRDRRRSHRVRRRGRAVRSWHASRSGRCRRRPCRATRRTLPGSGVLATVGGGAISGFVWTGDRVSELTVWMATTPTTAAAARPAPMSAGHHDRRCGAGSLERYSTFASAWWEATPSGACWRSRCPAASSADAIGSFMSSASWPVIVGLPNRWRGGRTRRTSPFSVRRASSSPPSHTAARCSVDTRSEFGRDVSGHGVFGSSFMGVADPGGIRRLVVPGPLRVRRRFFGWVVRWCGWFRRGGGG